MKYFKLFLLVQFIGFSVKSQTLASFENFWSKFQPVLVEKDYAKLSKHTLFPLKCKGMLDTDKIIKIGKPEFAKKFTTFLDLEVFGTDITFGTTKYDILKEMANVPENEKSNFVSGWARIDDMEFVWKKGKWWMNLIYDGHNEYSDRIKNKTSE